MIIVTRYAQRNKDTVLCKRNVFKRDVLTTIDSHPIDEKLLPELLKGEKRIHTVNVEKLSDLNLKTV